MRDTKPFDAKENLANVVARVLSDCYFPGKALVALAEKAIERQSHAMTKEIYPF